MAHKLSADDIMKRLEDEEIEWVDLRFTDPKGKWQHLTMAAGAIDEDMLEDGFMFDGSSIAGWKAINESDMILMPDPDTAVMDPFAAKPSMILFCDIVEPSTGQFYSRDPRATAKLADETLPALVTRLRSGSSVDTALNEIDHPRNPTHQRILRALDTLLAGA